MKMHIIDRLVDDRSLTTMSESREALIVLSNAMGRIRDMMKYDNRDNVTKCNVVLRMATEALEAIE